MNWKFLILIAAVLLGFWWLVSGNDTQKALGVTASGAAGTDVGDYLPSFEYTTITGNVIESDSLRGKVVLITSSAYWCSTCVAEAQELAKAYEDLDANNVYFLTVDIDPRSSIQDIAQFKIENSTPWDYTNATGGFEAINALKLNRFEITYIVSPEGVITYKDTHITSAQEAKEAIKSGL